MFKKLLVIVVTISISPVMLFANWVHQSFEFEGHNREYRIYTPPDYSPAKSYSLVIGIHGLWGSMYDFPNAVSDFQKIADTANIILVYPQGLDNPAPLGTGWNSSAGMLGLYPSENINDVGFINALTDSIQANYPIVKEQTYLFGFSNGGFMVQKIACEANNRYAAIASIAGTIGNKIKDCNPERKVPIIHFHGTADINVHYYNPPMGKSVSSLMRLWSENYNCSGREITTLNNIMSDGYTVERYLYKDCDERLELFRINNAAHILLNKAQNDISYPEEMWRFFTYKKDTAITVNIHTQQESKIKIYPNPTMDIIKIELKYIEKHHQLNLGIFDYSGKEVQSIKKNESGIYQFDCTQLPNGIYLIIAQYDQTYLSTHFIVAR